MVRPLPLLLAALMSPGLASADFAGLEPSGTSSVAFASGGFADDDRIVAFGYARDVDAHTVECPTTLFVSLRLEAPAHSTFDVHDGTLGAGMRFSLLRVATFAMPAQIGLALAISGNASDLRVTLGTDAALLPGFYAGGVSLATELMLTSRWATLHIRDENETFELRRASSHRVGLGVRAAVVVAGRLELVGRLGYTNATQIAHATPTYADISAGVRF